MNGLSDPMKSAKTWPRPKITLGIFLIVIAVIASALAFWINEYRDRERRALARLMALRSTGRKDVSSRYRDQQRGHAEELEKVRKSIASRPKGRSGFGVMSPVFPFSEEEYLIYLTELVEWEGEMASIFEKAADHPQEELPPSPPKPVDLRDPPGVHGRAVGMISANSIPSGHYLLPRVVKKRD